MESVVIRLYSISQYFRSYSDFASDHYDELAVIESCECAISEDVFDTRVVSTATTYTYSMVTELLDSVKEKLLKLCSVVLSLLNNYMLNSARYIDVYGDIIEEQVGKLKEPFSYSYYEYPDSTNYPVLLSGVNSVEGDIKKLQDAIIAGKWDSYRVEDAVDNMLINFSRKTIGGSIDPYSIRSSTEEIVTEHIRGHVIVKLLTKDDVKRFIHEFKTYRDYMNDIKRTKSNIEKEYTQIKNLYGKAIKRPAEIRSINALEAIYDREGAAFKANEQQRFSDINIQMTRLFTGFIDIYNKAFDTKLRLLQERIDMNKHIIAELMQRTTLLTTLQTKNPDRYKKPYKPDPKIKI